jgi:hypothetical protein
VVLVALYLSGMLCKPRRFSRAIEISEQTSREFLIVPLIASELTYREL